MSGRRARAGLPVLGIFGAALFYGDGVITPAISVLGAVEGLQVAAPALGKYVVWIALVILLRLFAVQRHGTHRVGKAFAPVMTLWFVVLAVLGVRADHRQSAGAVRDQPVHAARFFSAMAIPRSSRWAAWCWR